CLGLASVILYPLLICRQPADFKPPQPPIQTSGFKLRYLFQTAANLHRAPAPPLGEAL
ncbi:unnamed protein product, partial [Musa textilis]